jgi:hypothetical protein
MGNSVAATFPLFPLAPNLVKAAVEGRLPRGIGIERNRFYVGEVKYKDERAPSTNKLVGSHRRISTVHASFPISDPAFHI